MSTDPQDWNTKIIEEFRANEGRVGGPFEGGTLLLLHHLGRKTGVERVNPLAYFADGDRYVIVASKAGAPTNPDWYYNVVAHPQVTVEVGTETVAVDATEITGAARDALWQRVVAAMPGFGDYEKKTDRVIPLLALTRAG